MLMAIGRALWWLLMLPFRLPIWLVRVALWLFGFGVAPGEIDGVGHAIGLFSSVITITVGLVAALVFKGAQVNSESLYRYLAFYVLLASLPVGAMTFMLRSAHDGNAYNRRTRGFLRWAVPIAFGLIVLITVFGYSEMLPGQGQAKLFQIAEVVDYDSEQGEQAIKAIVYMNPSIYDGELPKRMTLKIELLGTLGDHWEFKRIDLFELTTGGPVEVLDGTYEVHEPGKEDPTAMLTGLKSAGAYRIDVYFAPKDDEIPRTAAKSLLLKTRNNIRIAQEAREDKSPNPASSKR